MAGLRLSQELLGQIVGHARQCLPNEACGLLGGNDRIVEQVYRLNNSNPTPATYIIDPDDHMKAIKQIESSGQRLVGIYHSHPDSPPLPSVTDINRAFFPGTREPNYPDVVYLIVGLSAPAPEIKAYLIDEVGVERVEIELS